MAAAPVPGVRWSGDRLGPYRIERGLGVGGMGAVYEAVEDVLERRVALKLIAPAYAEDPVFRQRFTAEAQAQASLDSAHVVQVFAHGEIDGRLFIATQLVPDGDLGRALAAGPLPRAAVLEIVAQVADGLAEAHRVGVTHRDIKPSNVLLRNRGDGWSAYLADFGIAHRTGTAVPEPPGQPAGTPGYLAPELYAGRPPGPASDVYALGAVLRLGVPDLAARGRRDRALRGLLARMLADDPDQRVAAADARDALRELADERPSRRSRRRAG